MNKITVAIPSEGKDGCRSDHFGHCPMFTLIDIENNQSSNMRTVANIAHGAGGCMKPVALLAKQGVKVMIAAGMGHGPYKKMQQLGMEVYFADLKNYPDVDATVTALIDGKLELFQHGRLCIGSGNCHH